MIKVAKIPNKKPDWLKVKLTTSSNFSDMKEGIPNHIRCISYPFYTEDYPMWDDLIRDIDPISRNIIRIEESFKKKCNNALMRS